MRNEAGEHTPNSLEQGLQEPEQIRSMFDAIAPTYDRLNHILSGGMDMLWRKKAIRLLEEKRGGAILDIAAGSGDLSLDALRLNPRLIVATDFAVNMLDMFDQKLKRTGSGRSIIQLAACDALQLPFANESFDVTMVAFGIRNFADRPAALREMLRVLKAGGVTMILELTEPKGALTSLLYRFYSNTLMPLIGGLISKHREAYAYLPASIARFPDQEEFLSIMRKAGFIETKAIVLTFGAATIFIGLKA